MLKHVHCVHHNVSLCHARCLFRLESLIDTSQALVHEVLIDFSSLVLKHHTDAVIDDREEVDNLSQEVKISLWTLLEAKPQDLNASELFWLDMHSELELWLAASNSTGALV